jgi:hypothetical protein
MDGKDLGRGFATISGGVFGLSIGRGVVGPRIEGAQWFSRRPRLGRFVRDSIIVAATIAGAAVGTAVGESVFGAGGGTVEVKK